MAGLDPSCWTASFTSAVVDIRQHKSVLFHEGIAKPRCFCNTRESIRCNRDTFLSSSAS
jgi:hypothetical protein